MKIGSDFDGVIADTYALVEKGIPIEAILAGEISDGQLRPLSDSVLDLLNENRIHIIVTARDSIAPVCRWLGHHAPRYKGIIQSCKPWNDSKALACKAHGVQVFVDDDPAWIQEISGAGISALHFDRTIHPDPDLIFRYAMRMAAGNQIVNYMEINQPKGDRYEQEI